MWMLLMGLVLSLETCVVHGWQDHHNREYDRQWSSALSTLSRERVATEHHARELALLSKYLLIDDSQILLKLISKTQSTPLHALQRFTDAVAKLILRNVPPTKVHAQDAMSVDADNHELIMENEYFRVLWTTLKAGKTCKPHTHQYPSVLLITSGLKFLTQEATGSSVEEEWRPGVYELEPDVEPIGFTNISACDFEALCVELKKTVPQPPTAPLKAKL